MACRVPSYELSSTLGIQGFCLQLLGGAALCTFKLHLASSHLPDQARTGGAAFFSLEFWVERLVQLYKRFIRHRSSGKPELLFVQAEVLTRACRRMQFGDGGEVLMSVLEAVRVHRVKRARKRAPKVRGARGAPLGAPDETARGAGVHCAEFVGAPRSCSAAEIRTLLPDYGGQGDLSGIPYILQTVSELDQERWPTHPDARPHRVRCARIARDLGVPVAGTVQDSGFTVSLQKFHRCVLPSGDSLSSVEYKRPFVSDDTWCLVKYDEERRDGRVEKVYYVGHILMLVEATLDSQDGVDSPRDLHPSSHASSEGLPARPAGPLPVAYVELFHAEAVSATGSRPDSGIRPHDLWAVRCTRGRSQGRCSRPVPRSAGRWAIHIEQIVTQLLRGPEVNGMRLFSVSGKSSGMIRSADRFRSVARVSPAPQNGHYTGDDAAPRAGD